MPVKLTFVQGTSGFKLLKMKAAFLGMHVVIRVQSRYTLITGLQHAFFFGGGGGGGVGGVFECKN